MGGIASLLQPKRVQGQGDGLSDSIPANLSAGEYVLPAQVVSALGNGDTQAGAKLLDEFVKRVYQAQTGQPKQMKPISLAQLVKGL